MSAKKNRPLQRAAKGYSNSNLPDITAIVHDPPKAVDTEQVVLGTLMVHPEAIPGVADKLSPNDFYNQDHRIIYSVLIDIQDDNRLDGSSCVAMVCDRLTETGEFEQIGGNEYLIDLVDVAAGPVGVNLFVDKVCDAAEKRCLLDDSIQTIRDIGAADHDPEARQRLAEKIPANPIGGELAGIEFFLSSGLGSDDQVDFLWEGWLARGYITLLVALWKAGKSTLLAHVLKAASDGGNIAGQIYPTKVLIITEEGRGLWARRREEVGIGDHVTYVIRPFKGRPTGKQWKSFITAIAGKVASGSYGVVVIDTWQSVSPCHDENDAATMMAALTPLHQLTEAGAAVLIIHHTRKGDGSEGQASRGSGALTGFVDIIMELRRYDPERHDDTRRVLKGLSRFDETLAKVVIDLRDDGYQTTGLEADAKQSDRMRVIDEILSDTEHQMTAEEVHERWKDDTVARPSIRTLRSDLTTGCHSDSSKWQKSGCGKKGDPFRYSKCDSGKPHPLDAGIESESEE